MIRSKPSTKEYRDNYDRIFKKPVAHDELDSISKRGIAQLGRNCDGMMEHRDKLLDANVQTDNDTLH